MAEKIGERKNARRKNVCLCKGRTHKRAHTRIHGHGADGWKASHSEHEYRRMEFDIVHKSHTNAQSDKHVRVRTLFIACDAKRLPLHGHPSHSKHTHTLTHTSIGHRVSVFVRGSDIEFLVAHCLPFVSCACGGYTLFNLSYYYIIIIMISFFWE